MVQQNNMDRTLALIDQANTMSSELVSHMWLIGAEVKAGRMTGEQFFGALGFLNHSMEQIVQTQRLLHQIAKNAARDYHHMTESFDDVEGYITQQIELAKDELLLQQWNDVAMGGIDIDEWADRILRGEGDMLMKEKISELRQAYRQADDLARAAEAMQE